MIIYYEDSKDSASFNPAACCDDYIGNNSVVGQYIFESTGEDT